ncbi:class I tRNA ligase family protein [Pseudoalteromonas sp. Hal099]
MIKKHTISQLFDPEKGIFLPDRFVTGTFAQRVILKTKMAIAVTRVAQLTAQTELINPRSVMSGAEPILKDSEHYFFDLPAFEGMLKEWLALGLYSARNGE